MKQIRTALVACVMATAAFGQAFAADPAMALPAADRAVLDKLLGPGVAQALDGGVSTDPEALALLAADLAPEHRAVAPLSI